MVVVAVVVARHQEGSGTHLEVLRLVALAAVVAAWCLSGCTNHCYSHPQTHNRNRYCLGPLPTPSRRESKLLGMEAHNIKRKEKAL